MKDLLQKIYNEDILYYDILHEALMNRGTKQEKAFAKMFTKKVSESCIEFSLHPDDDLEEAEEIVLESLYEEYNIN